MIGLVQEELTLMRGPEGFREHRWVLVQTGEKTIPAVDLAQCAVGDRVIVLEGSTLRGQFCLCPGDWAVAAVVDSGK